MLMIYHFLGFYLSVCLCLYLFVADKMFGFFFYYDNQQVIFD